MLPFGRYRTAAAPILLLSPDPSEYTLVPRMRSLWSWMESSLVCAMLDGWGDASLGW